MTERHFRVVQLDGKKVEFGGVSITSKASPGSAARKLLTSIAHEKGLKKNKKASMPKVKFCIQEYTQGSSKKVYGPYVGHFHKYTAAELKKAATAKGKIKFTMKPVVKLAKGKNNMKGGNNTGSRNKNGNLILGHYVVNAQELFNNKNSWRTAIKTNYIFMRASDNKFYKVPHSIPKEDIEKAMYVSGKSFVIPNPSNMNTKCLVNPGETTCKLSQ